MIKSELVEHIVNKFSQLPVEVAEQGVCQILDYMSETLSKGRRIEIRGFGSFSVRYHSSRNAYNPKTKEKVISKEKYTSYFRPGKEMRERINEAYLNKIPIIFG
jgi:integration host factor subunit beta